MESDKTKFKGVMKMYKIMVKGKYYPITLAVIKAVSEQDAIRIYRARTKERCEVEVVRVF